MVAITSAKFLCFLNKPSKQDFPTGEDVELILAVFNYAEDSGTLQAQLQAMDGPLRLKVPGPPALVFGGRFGNG